MRNRLTEALARGGAWSTKYPFLLTLQADVNKGCKRDVSIINSLCDSCTLASYTSFNVNPVITGNLRTSAGLSVSASTVAVADASSRLGLTAPSSQTITLAQ